MRPEGYDRIMQERLQSQRGVETIGYLKVTIDGREFYVNPRQIRWFKDFKLTEFDIPYYKNKTQSMGAKLWQCELTIRTVTEAERKFLWNLGEPEVHPGPHLLVTAGADSAMCVYLLSKSQLQEAAEGDDVFLWQLHFIEASDGN